MITPPWMSLRRKRTGSPPLKSVCLSNMTARPERRGRINTSLTVYDCPPSQISTVNVYCLCCVEVQWSSRDQTLLLPVVCPWRVTRLCMSLCSSRMETNLISKCKKKILIKVRTVKKKSSLWMLNVYVVLKPSEAGETRPACSQLCFHEIWPV